MEPSLNFVPIFYVTGTFHLPKIGKRDDSLDAFDKTLKEMTKGSIAKEMAIGGVAGWCSGVVFARVSKTAASALAGGVFLFRVAQHHGYIKINWNKVNKDLEKAKKEIVKGPNEDGRKLLEEIARLSEKSKQKISNCLSAVDSRKSENSRVSQWFANGKSFVNEYKFLVTGFVGGFLIGIAMM